MHSNFFSSSTVTIVTLAERKINLYNKAIKNFLPSVIEIHIFLRYIFQINIWSAKYDNKISDKHKMRSFVCSFQYLCRGLR